MQFLLLDSLMIGTCTDMNFTHRADVYIGAYRRLGMETWKISPVKHNSTVLLCMNMQQKIFKFATVALSRYYL